LSLYLAAVLACLLGAGIVVPRAGAEQVTLPLTQCLELGASADAVTFSPDGCFFLVTIRAEGHEHVVRVDARTWTTTQLPIDISTCYPLCLNPDGSLLVYGFAGTVHVVDTETLHDALLLAGKPRAYSFSPDGKLLASVDQTNRLTVWDVGTWHEVRSFQLPCAYGDVGVLAFASGGDALVAFGEARITTWAVSSRNPIGCLEYSGPASLSQLVPDGEELALYGDDGTLRVLDLDDGRQIASSPVSRSAPSCLRFAPSARFILSTDSSGPNISIFSVLSGALIASLEGDPLDIHSAAFCPKGDYVVSVGHTGRVCVWDVSALESYRCSSFEITEVNWQSGSITITNRTTIPLNLLGWTISDGGMSYTFRSSLWVAGGRSCVINPSVFGPDNCRSGLQIDATDKQVSLLAPEVFGGSEESMKRQ
jgi:WD40 repeat protein